MKQALWIVNSSILGIFFSSLAVLHILHKEPSRFIPLSIPDQTSTAQKKEPFPISYWEPIFKNDLFGTYVARPTQQAPSSLVTPIPALQETPPPPPPEPAKPEFIPELTLSLKGIIVAADETQNVAMIEDEAKKELLYHVGDQFKDGQIIKISRNNVVFLRANGQQETFYLRKEDADLAMDGPTKWEFVIKKVDDTNWQIDPDSFAHEVSSVGDFIERTGILGTAYKNGIPIGVSVGDVEKDSLGMLLGLQKGDLLLTINGTSVAVANDRVNIYDTITKMNSNDTIVVTLKRGGQSVQLSYKLSYISKAKKMVFQGDPKDKDAAAKQDEALKMSKLQERDKQIRDFETRHNNNNNQQDAIAQIRKRLLDNLRARMQGAQVR